MDSPTLTIYRKIYNTEPRRNVIGELFGNGEWLCYTLEDEVRPDGVKVPGATALPAYDKYWVKPTWSPKFGRMMPLIYTERDLSINVKGVRFSGVRCHNGVHEGHTEGCVLTGLTTNGLTLTSKAEHVLMSWLDKHKANWPIPLRIVDMPLTGGGLTQREPGGTEQA